MGFRIKPKKSSSKTEGSSWKIVGEIRKSQSITTYGPGALIDFPRMVLMTGKALSGNSALKR